jgi:hypothetical protein
VKLTPEDFERLQTKQIANAIRKLNAGKTLTGREETLLAKARAGGDGDEPAATVQTSGNFAATWDELAQACTVDRRTLTNVRERFAKELKEQEGEWLRADGRKGVAWWIRFLDEKGVRGRGVNNPQIDYIDERQLRLRREKVQLDKAEFELEVAKEKMLPVTDFEHALSVTVGNFNATLNAMPGRATAKIINRARTVILALLEQVLTAKQYEKVDQALNSAQIDYADIVEILQDEVDLAKRMLETCDYLTVAPETE